MFDVRFLDLEWKALPNTSEKKFNDAEQIPIPDFSAIVDRCLRENKSQEVWDMVSMLTNTYISMCVVDVLTDVNNGMLISGR